MQLVFLLVGIGQDLLIRWLKRIFVPYEMLAYEQSRS